MTHFAEFECEIEFRIILIFLKLIESYGSLSLLNFMVEDRLQ